MNEGSQGGDENYVYADSHRSKHVLMKPEFIVYRLLLKSN